MTIIDELPKGRVVGKVYANKDDKHNVLTYSVYEKMKEGFMHTEFNTFREASNHKRVMFGG